MVPLRKERFTEAEYFERLAASELKLELWDGAIVGMAGASDEHIDVESALAGEVFRQLAGRGCRALTSNQAVKLAGNRGYVFPDLVIVCGPVEREQHRGISCLLNPTAVFEVLSPSTAQTDTTRKLHAYTQLKSVREYVVLESSERLVTRYSRTGADELWSTAVFSEDGDVVELVSCGVGLALRQIYRGTDETDPEVETPIS
jgi:Uma2 family endonuclease